MKCLSRKVRWIPSKITAECKGNLSRRLLAFSLVFCFILVVNAQSGKPTPGTTARGKGVSGVVRDNSGQSVIGAIVKIKDGNSGTVTDIDGKFNLPGVIKKTLVEISYMGYEKKEIFIEPGVLARITLEPKSHLVNEVVVVGYGTQKKINVTGSLATISS
ncbi:MAG: carboxypeptidase-like regulatory domain-containing protein, partial [Bacteroidota bacterium]|nr:carboxypeptidase-like regulatory domain-containing protein [Bacteroidota bacterium]